MVKNDSLLALKAENDKLKAQNDMLNNMLMQLNESLKIQNDTLKELKAELAELKKNGNSYQGAALDYTNIAEAVNKKLEEEKKKTEAEVEKALQVKIAEIKKRDYPAMYLDTFKHKPKTQRTYKYTFQPFLRWLQEKKLHFMDVQSNDIKEYIDKTKADKLSLNSQSVRVSLLRGFYNYIIIDLKEKNEPDVFRFNPVKDEYTVNVTTAPQEALSVDDTLNFLETAKCFQPYGFYAEFIVATGVRIDELLHIKKRDIKLAEGVVVIRHGKGDKERLAPFPDILKPEILKHIRSLDDDDRVFNHTDDTVRQHFAHIGRVAGIERKVKPHLLRHTYVTSGVEFGANIEVLSKNVGHSDLRTTRNVYFNPEIENRKAEVNKYTILQKMKSLS